MKRSTVVLDRLGVLIIGLAVAALGVAAVLWKQDRLGIESIDASSVVDLQDQQWWPWALLGAGVLVALLVLLSLLRRLPSSSGRDLALPVTDEPDGTVTVDLRAVTKKAAEAARAVDGVKSARSRFRRERISGRRVPVITVIARAEKGAATATVARDLGDVRSAVASVVGDDAVGVRVLLSGS